MSLFETIIYRQWDISKYAQTGDIHWVLDVIKILFVLELQTYVYWCKNQTQNSKNNGVHKFNKKKTCSMRTKVSIFTREWLDVKYTDNIPIANLQQFK